MNIKLLSCVFAMMTVTAVALAQEPECQSAFIRLSGNLPSTIPVDSRGHAEPVILSFSLSDVGASEEHIYLRAARVREDQWRLNFARNESGDLDEGHSGINLLLNFDGAGQQLNSVGFIVQPHSANARVAGSALSVNFEQFTQLDLAPRFAKEVIRHEASQCGYDGQIVGIKTRADSVRDELNPIIIQER